MIAHADAFDFNLKLRALTKLADCAGLFREAIAPFGFDTFACGEFDSRDRDRSVFFIIDWPEDWRRFYIGTGLINRDPLLDELSVVREPFTWVEMRAGRKLRKLGTEVLDRLAEGGWSEGLVVPMPGPGNRTGLVSLAGHQQIGIEAKRYLSLISVCLHHHARVLLPREGAFPVPPAGLSEREIAATRLVAQGLGDLQIANTLGVARSTAHEFVEKAKVKLKTRTRAELVALAVSLGIVDI